MCSKSYTRNPFEKAVSERGEKPLSERTVEELKAELSWLNDMVKHCDNVMGTLADMQAKTFEKAIRIDDELRKRLL